MTYRPCLSETLDALIAAVTQDHPWLSIEEADIELPLLVGLEHGSSGPVLRAHPPYSAFRSGVEPIAHMASIRLRTIASDDIAGVVAPQPEPEG